MGTEDWKFLEHTADIYVEISGKSISELFLHATKGFSELLAPARLLEGPPDDFSLTWKFNGDGYDDLLMSWLKEMLYYSQVEGIVVTSADIHVLTPEVIEATIRGKELNSEEWLDEADAEIKAVTYHNFRVGEVPGGYKAWVVFDI